MPLFGASGSRIAYEAYEGPTGAPPLLLLHGFTASSACWISNLPGLSERFAVITADLLGHGDSDAPDQPELYTPAAAIARLEALLDYLGHAQVLVCGHSLGGALALRFALDRPERVAGVVVLNSNSAAGTPEWRENARAGMTAMAAKARAEGTDFLKETRLYPAQGTRLPHEARALLTRDFERLTPAGFAGTAEALVIDVNAFERLGSLQVPALVVIGNRDHDFVKSAPRFVVRMPRDLVDTFTIEGAGHAANLEQPDLFNEALFSFAERIGYLPPDDEEYQPTIVPDDGRATENDAPGLAAALFDDDGLGPTLYEDLRRAMGARGQQFALTVAGFGLIGMGAALLAGAFFVANDNGDGQATTSGDATATPAVVDQALGIRTAAPKSPTARLTTTVAAARPSTESEGTATPTAEGALVPPADDADGEPAGPDPTEITDETPEPTVDAVESPTPTPSGPWVRISGPAAAAVGEPITFSASESVGALRRDWSASNGAAAAHTSWFTVTFATAGCHSVTVTALFPSGSTASTQVVAVGVESCPGG